MSVDCEFCRDAGALQPDSAAMEIDYKNTTLLRRFVTDDGKLRSRRETGICSVHQQDIAVAVKISREVALLPRGPAARA